VDPYAVRVLELYLLRKGGYPFGPDDLDAADRVIIGAVEVGVERRRLADALTAVAGIADREGD